MRNSYMNVHRAHNSMCIDLSILLLLFLLLLLLLVLLLPPLLFFPSVGGAVRRTSGRARSPGVIFDRITLLSGVVELLRVGLATALVRMGPKQHLPEQGHHLAFVNVPGQRHAGQAVHGREAQQERHKSALSQLHRPRSRHRFGVVSAKGELRRGGLRLEPRLLRETNSLPPQLCMNENRLRIAGDQLRPMLRICPYPG